MVFAWNEFCIGNTVRVSTTNQQLEDIALDETYMDTEGIVTRSNSKATVVNFGKDTRALYNNMLVKVEHTYNDMPDIDTYSDEYINQMNAIYGGEM